MSCSGHKGLKVAGYGWERHGTQWTRWLVRRCKECLKLHLTELVWVEIEYAWCLACLSQEVVPLPNFEDPVRYFCTECGATTWVDYDLVD